MPFNNKFASRANKQKQKFGNYFEFVNGEKSTKFLDIINRAKAPSPIFAREYRPAVVQENIYRISDHLGRKEDLRKPKNSMKIPISDMEPVERKMSSVRNPFLPRSRDESQIKENGEDAANKFQKSFQVSQTTRKPETQLETDDIHLPQTLKDNHQPSLHQSTSMAKKSSDPAPIPELILSVPKQFDYRSCFKLRQFQIQQEFTKIESQARIDIHKLLNQDQDHFTCENDPNYSKAQKRSHHSQLQHMKQIQLNFERMNSNVKDNIEIKIKDQQQKEQRDGKARGDDDHMDDECDLGNYLSQITQDVNKSKMRIQQDYYVSNPKARAPSSCEDEANDEMQDQEMQQDEEPMDEEKQYQEEMEKREQNIIQSFLYNPENGQKIQTQQTHQESRKSEYFQEEGMNTQNYSNMNNNDYYTQVQTRNQSHHNPYDSDYFTTRKDTVQGQTEQHQSQTSESYEEYTIMVEK